MIRLNVIVEGQTEEAFVREVLAPHLLARQVWARPTVVGTARSIQRGRGGRGGGRFRTWRRDLQRILGSRDKDLRVTTLFDLYGLPDDFPGYEEHAGETDTKRRCDSLQVALAQEFPDRRLIPYLQRHEFEALVLASLPSLRELLDAEDDLAGYAALLAEVGDGHPEDTNDGRETAPSRRLLRHIPGYQKTFHGPYAIRAAGLAKIRARCPRFDAWLGQLEALDEEAEATDAGEPGGGGP